MKTPCVCNSQKKFVARLASRLIVVASFLTLALHGDRCLLRVETLSRVCHTSFPRREVYCHGPVEYRSIEMFDGSEEPTPMVKWTVIWIRIYFGSIDVFIRDAGMNTPKT
ncbi:hypothetical protein E7745_14605 [Duncaniella sp. C9]|uniref:hypothetical protein n=1 Tax=Duncaniella sp. C9 TaxID=2530392 RepID=UPI0010A3B843|nr:hypothetical protein [Duncaniella sp. C9]QCD40652.1 hypothetical protein E7745_14605 [Duncaniella sp. C9]